MITLTKEQREELIGKTIKGFDFKNNYGRIGYLSSMNAFIGVEGKIINYFKGNDQGHEYECFNIKFDENYGYSYPADLVYKQYLSETKTEDEIYVDIYSLLRSIK